jgi:hypothetical protein
MSTSQDDLIARLTPALGSLARLIANGTIPTEQDDDASLLAGLAVGDEEAARRELRRWSRLLVALHADPARYGATVEALRLRGLPEATALLAATTVTGLSPSQATTRPAAPTDAATPAGPSRLIATPTELNFGHLAPGEPATAELIVSGDTGEASSESSQVRVSPTIFGPSPTRLTITLAPLPSGILTTTIRLRTATGTVEVPIDARWMEKRTTNESSATPPQTNAPAVGPARPGTAASAWQRPSSTAQSSDWQRPAGTSAQNSWVKSVPGAQPSSGAQSPPAIPALPVTVVRNPRLGDATYWTPPVSTTTVRPPQRRSRAPLVIGAGLGIIVLIAMLGLAAQNQAASAHSTATAQAAYIATSSAATAQSAATATIQAASTATAQANATATSNAQATTTASIQAAATATTRWQLAATATIQAQATATALAIAQATAANQSQARATADSWAGNAQIVFGPEGGTLIHNPPDGKVAVFAAPNSNLSNVIVEARFSNPLPTSQGAWDYGFSFRSTTTVSYAIVVHSNATWDFMFTTNVVSGYQRVTSGKIPNLDATTNGQNSLTLFVNGSNALFFVNGTYITTLDVSASLAPGVVFIGTGFFTGDEVAGMSTNYELFIVREIR